MANKKISDFTAITVVDKDDLIEIETIGGNSRKAKKRNAMPGPLGVLALKKSTNQSIVTGAWRLVSWDVEMHDNLNAFSSGSSTTDFTVPSGITVMRVNLRAGWANNSTSNRYLSLYNVTTSTDVAIDIKVSANESGQTLNSGLIEVTAGHVYRIQANSGSQTLNLSGTEFGGASILTVEFFEAWANTHI
ncbi:hypothetical protein MRBLMA1_001251 [Sphingobium sp. LMA1-1-1.1]|uniref:hypothetical protein n=1 Tax=Sphingobium sp. LMA1-1-1.1 TaxID=3135238 RepID=UPI00343A0ADA